MLSAFMSAAYIQVHRLDFIKEANTMDPNHTAPKLDQGYSLGTSVIWVHSVSNIGFIRISTDERAGDKSHDWGAKSYC